MEWEKQKEKQQAETSNGSLPQANRRLYHHLRADEQWNPARFLYFIFYFKLLFLKKKKITFTCY